jgi:hypothetical protein
MTTAKELHVAADPGVVRDHEASADCWCRPQPMYPLEDGYPVAYLHRGAAARIVRFKEARR